MVEQKERLKSVEPPKALSSLGLAIQFAACRRSSLSKGGRSIQVAALRAESKALGELIY
jgi:hypothetical protein